MKQTLSLLFLTALLAASCSKKSTDTPDKPSTPTVLLTKIVNNITGDPNAGKSLAEFTYNGKQLSKAVIYHYSVTPDVETDLFSYDNNGHLTGSTISHTVSNSYDYISSTVIYSGDHISEIKFYKTGNVLDQDITLTYQNGNLTSWFNPNEVKLTYEYDNKGHNTKQTAVEYQSGNPDGYQYVSTASTFDDKSNLSNALPLWVYFRVSQEDESFSFTTGANNPLTANDDGTDLTYNYQYNSYGYPSAISWTDGSLQSYQYEYTKVN